MKVPLKLVKKLDAALTSSDLEAAVAAWKQEAVASWKKGASQNFKGKILSEFADQFLLRFPADQRKEIEEHIVQLHKAPAMNLKRFRTKMILDWAAFFQNGANAARNGEDVDIKKMITDIGDKLNSDTD